MFTSRSLAVGYIEGFLARPIDASEGVHPSAARDAKRRKLEDRQLASSGAGGSVAQLEDS